MLENGADSFLVTDKTAFYAESGGQVGDTGCIYGDGFTFEVENTTKTNDGVFLHYGRITEGDNAKTGDSVRTVIDTNRRDAIARNHTAAHLLQAALRKTLGSHVEQGGRD